MFLGPEPENVVQQYTEVLNSLIYKDILTLELFIIKVLWSTIYDTILGFRFSNIKIWLSKFR